jgi:hypothetical protein
VPLRLVNVSKIVLRPTRPATGDVTSIPRMPTDSGCIWLVQGWDRLEISRQSCRQGFPFARRFVLTYGGRVEHDHR